MQRVVLTLDVDWAPDAAIDFAAEILVREGVKATWFVTHDSPAVRRLRARPDLFELGIHPNFLAGSSHGVTPEEVLAFCMELVPDAISMRTHALVQSTPLFDLVLERTPIRCDASILLPYAERLELLEHQRRGKTLLRVPYHWEDDVEMLRHAPSWTLERALSGGDLRVFAFHPIHVLLNSADFGPYEALKASAAPLSAASGDAIARFANRGAGSRTVFAALVAHLARAGGGEHLRDVYARWKEAR